MEAKAKALSVLGGRAIRAIRENHFQITQAEACRIFGGGDRAFAKYETHQALPSDSMSKLILLAFERPSVFEILKAGRLPAPAELAARLTH